MFNPVTYLKQVREEVKKVDWPDKNKTFNLTLVVIVVSVAIALYLTGLDYILNKFITFLINR
jgi:preprotein translocase subunit SecE